MKAKLRCAIYTRKSSEEGLDQAFNSLDAQREACEAYIKSQAGEGWSLVKARYDDGGFSGGSLERPALKALLEAVDQGLADIVVVYKVDRLTRALADFARIVDRFDAKGVSFVSVTQAFNTTTSMGRLTLNVLLSFAQFEREVTGERIRDKVAASKKKGMWMGGNLPLGYERPTDLTTRALVVNDPEAETVRLIFRTYLQLGSVHGLKRWLDQNRIVPKQWVSTRGRPMGGSTFSRGALFHLLKNRIYVGQIVHRGDVHPGGHPAIVDDETFDQVQALLAEQTRRHQTQPSRVASAPLKGLIFDVHGQPMSPTFTHGRKGKLHRYYVSAPLQQGGHPPNDDGIYRAPAELVERLVERTVDPLLSRSGEATWAACVRRVELHPATVQLVVDRQAMIGGHGDVLAQCDLVTAKLPIDARVVGDLGGRLRITLPIRFKLRGGRTWIIGANGEAIPRKDAADTALAKGLRAAHRLLLANSEGPAHDPARRVITTIPKSWYERQLMRLAFLAPDIQERILDGQQPVGVTLEDIIRGDVPSDWDEQRRRYGFA
jgi:DNA invertase Pin-like site-specific DNA recombinase